MNNVIAERQQLYPPELIEKRRREVLYDKKWHRFLKRAWLFRHLPFVEFVFGSGSMAVGNVDEESDFDVLIGARGGRIFTARFLTALAFGLFGWRRAKEHGHADAADKVCLNHFVTPASYRLRLRPNAYWKLLYQRLVPVYGSQATLQAFYDANSDWAGPLRYQPDLRHRHRASSLLARLLQWCLGGKLGDGLETKLKEYQVRRIERSGIASEQVAHQMRISGAQQRAKVKLAPLINYSDEELEFHPDPAVIELTG